MILVVWVESWEQDALCAQIGGDLWFADDRDCITDRQTAVELCYTCPVRMQCLSKAMRLERGLSRQSRYGVWGGLINGQRAELENR